VDAALANLDWLGIGEWLLADTGIIQRLNRKVSANNERLSTNEMGCGSAPRSGPITPTKA